MRKALLIAAATVCIGLLLALAAPAAAEQVIDGFNSPESVARSATHLYVSNLGVKLEPTALDGDGYISLLNLDGTVAKKDFITGLNGPKGLLLLGNTLYVADCDHLRGFDAATGAKVFEADFTPEKTLFLNAIAARDGETLYVSATDLNRIYEVDLKSGGYRALDVAVNGPNGLWYSPRHKRLYVAGFASKENKPAGEVGVIDLAGEKPSYRRLIDRPGFYDGIKPMGRGTILVSDWIAFEPGKGVLLKINVRKGTYETLPGGYGGPADFLYLPPSGMLYLPRMIDGKLEIKKLR